MTRFIRGFRNKRSKNALNKILTNYKRPKKISTRTYWRSQMPLWSQNTKALWKWWSSRFLKINLNLSKNHRLNRQPFTNSFRRLSNNSWTRLNNRQICFFVISSPLRLLRALIPFEKHLFTSKSRTMRRLLKRLRIHFTAIPLTKNSVGQSSPNSLILH